MGSLLCFIFSIAMCNVILISSCSGEVIQAKKLWDDHKKVCGHSIEQLSQSVRARIQNQTNQMQKVEENGNRKNIIISYEDFRCCLKKSWIEDIMFHPIQLRCMQQMIDCIVESQKQGCTLKTTDYLILTFSHYGIGVMLIFTIVILITSCYVCSHLQNYYAEY